LRTEIIVVVVVIIIIIIIIITTTTTIMCVWRSLSVQFPLSLRSGDIAQRVLNLGTRWR